jgi:hypothetical protein
MLMCVYRGVAGFIAFLLHVMIAVSFLGTIGLDIRPLITTLGLSGFVVGKYYTFVLHNCLVCVRLVVTCSLQCVSFLHCCTAQVTRQSSTQSLAEAKLCH